MQAVRILEMSWQTSLDKTLDDQDQDVITMDDGAYACGQMIITIIRISCHDHHPSVAIIRIFCHDHRPSVAIITIFCCDHHPS